MTPTLALSSVRNLTKQWEFNRRDKDWMTGLNITFTPFFLEPDFDFLWLLLIPPSFQWRRGFKQDSSWVPVASDSSSQAPSTPFSKHPRGFERPRGREHRCPSGKATVWDKRRCLKQLPRMLLLLLFKLLTHSITTSYLKADGCRISIYYGINRSIICMLTDDVRVDSPVALKGKLRFHTSLWKSCRMFKWRASRKKRSWHPATLHKTPGLLCVSSWKRFIPWQHFPLL